VRTHDDLFIDQKFILGFDLFFVFRIWQSLTFAASIF